MLRSMVKKILPFRDRVEKRLGRVRAKYVNFQNMQLRPVREVSSFPHFSRRSRGMESFRDELRASAQEATSNGAYEVDVRARGI